MIVRRRGRERGWGGEIVAWGARRGVRGGVEVRIGEWVDDGAMSGSVILHHEVASFRNGWSPRSEVSPTLVLEFWH